MLTPPERVSAGDRVSAHFLNYCRDGVTAESGFPQGILDLGYHPAQRGDSAKCLFQAIPEEDIPSRSVFRVREYSALPYISAAREYQNSTSLLYTNGDYPKKAGEAFYPYLIGANKTYQLQADTDVDLAPSKGALCQAKVGDWTVQKGGKDLLCLEPANSEGWGLFLGLASTSVLQVGFVVDNDIGPRSQGVIQLYAVDDITTQIKVDAYNPHDVNFFKENTDPVEGYPADRVILFPVIYWTLPLIFPFMLSNCADYAPTFEPEYA